MTQACGTEAGCKRSRRVEILEVIDNSLGVLYGLKPLSCYTGILVSYQQDWMERIEVCGLMIFLKTSSVEMTEV